MSVPGGMPDGAAPDHRPSDRTLVIIPTYNELDNLLTIVSRVNDSAPDVHV
ncbi:dolichol-phosphate mannosyltransferase, partial [Mycobacterium sp. ITM-2017-0098]